jgi:ribose 5-phosphate isomerase B
MKIYIGADHRGVFVKNAVVLWLEELGYSVEDLGAYSLDKEDDYVDYASLVAQHVVDNPENRGILLCGTGVGMSVAANKHKGIRCALTFIPSHAKAARNDDDCNVLALPAEDLPEHVMREVIQAFLETPFANEERFVRRLTKIKELEVHA